MQKLESLRAGRATSASCATCWSGPCSRSAATRSATKTSSFDTAAARCRRPAGGLPADEWEIRPLDEVIANYVNAAVEATGGNVRKAARQLQISPSTLYARLKDTGKE